MEGREEIEETGATGSEEIPASAVSLAAIARALEKLAADPEVEIEVGPPICPSCGMIDPEILLPEQESLRGPMSELVVDGLCCNCNHQIYIVIESYSVHQGKVTAMNEIRERKKAGFFDGQVR